MQDASGKLVKRYIQDENGDGVPDAAPGGAQVAAAPDPKTRMNALRKRIGLPEL
jgi:hypothetical protein